MTTYDFDNIDQWIAKVERRLEHTVQKATHDVFDAAQTPRERGGNMPVASGRLRDSLTMNLSGIEASGATSYRATSALVKPGDKITGYWSTGYESLAEFGGNGRPGAFFREAAIGAWPRIVAEAVADAKVKNK